jgi:hypothetical protein
MTRLGIEVKNLKMRVESMSSRLDFDERRARALEGVVQYRPGAVAPLQPPTGANGQTLDSESSERRTRRRRRRGRRRSGHGGHGEASERTQGGAPPFESGGEDRGQRAESHPPTDTTGRHDSSES